MGSIFFQNLVPAKHEPFYAHETKHSIHRLFIRIKKMSDMKIKSIGNGNETKQHHLSLPNKSKKINSKSITKNQQV